MKWMVSCYFRTEPAASHIISVPPQSAVELLEGMKVLARREKDGYYCPGTIRERVRIILRKHFQHLLFQVPTCFHVPSTWYSHSIEGIVEFFFKTANAFQLHGFCSYSLYLGHFYALLGPKIAMKVFFRPQNMWNLDCIRSFQFSSSFNKIWWLLIN